MKLATWNVNGIRACINKGFWQWFEASKLHILCLQETRASNEVLTSLFGTHEKKDHYFHYFTSAEKKGYSGVAILAKRSLGTPLSVVSHLGIKEFDSEGRTIILEYDDFYFVGAYFPNGQRDHSRVDYKLRYSYFLKDYCLSLRKKTGKGIIMTGDFNTAHREIDLKNPKSNVNTTGFLKIERAFIDDLIADGFVDIFREKHPGKEGEYTWWTYRGDCRARNVGWRIDYFFVTEDLRSRISRSYHGPEVMGSDHCPVYLEIK